ncbi:RIP metalloprotease RseP [Duganella sp. FT80W]|uniref:Zinc metalloprotease n=1 Tax=Duganella guangzhouensis TaxID=2666084 RepID=A0A6I2L160_9BURK|nr:RIP metalloprotease RseP [Duganella guangzhouensis]MRW90009.1 RIP metalloprotease RseP [Duganella guangzhouensis]
MNFLSTPLAFILCIGPLVVFHELGHYLVARWCGVKVLRFSVGFGKVLWSRRFGKDQTEWALSALPLGGYVKMLDAREGNLGDLPEADLKREFTRQNVWKRIAIVAAGPIANFLVAIALFAGLYMHGVEEPSSKISVLTPDMPQAAKAGPAAGTAHSAGLHSGDLVVAVNEQPVHAWSELRWQFIQSAIDKHEIRLTVERPSQGRLVLTLPASAMSGLDLEDDVPAQLGVGIARLAPIVNRVLPGSPAERAGLRSEDVLLSIDGAPVTDAGAFIEAVQGAPERAVKVEVQRDGQPILVSVVPEAASAEAKSGKGTVTVGKIGAEIANRPDMIKVPSSPLGALSKGVVRVWDTCTMTLKMLGKMLTGEASLKNVTGPLTIADYAGQTARMGAISFLSFVAFISVSLGIMNLLPIPVLDGGHLLYYSLEVLTGRSVPERVGEIAQRLGMGLLLTLMLLAVFNDVARLL